MPAVLFDLDDTLYAYAPSHQAGLAAATEVLTGALDKDAPALEAAYAHARTQAFEALGPVASAHSRHVYFKWVIEAARGRTDVRLALAATQAYWEGALAAMRPAPGGPELLATLGSAGLRLGVLTDLTVEIQLRKLTKLGLDEAFEVVVTSEEAGRDKPDPAGFLRALSALGTRPEDAVMVGDNPVNDVRGALEAGLRAVWLAPPDAPEAPPGVLTVGSLAALREPAALAFLGAAP